VSRVTKNLALLMRRPPQDQPDEDLIAALPEPAPSPALPARQPPPPLPAAAAFGYPELRRAGLGASLTAPAQGGSPEPGADLTAERTGTCLVSIATRNYLHFGRALVSSSREHHPEIPVFLLIVDPDPGEALEVPGATLLSGAGIGVPSFDFMALKYTATEMCCALKPYVIRHLLATTRFARILYFDSDIYLYARLDALLRALDEHDFVVTPHTLAPFPHPERFWERPSLGDLAFAGPFNAGLFGLRANARTAAFLEVWRQMVTEPGAFLFALGGQMEQNSFNWISCFADDVHVLRDAAYNVAYWNLHDRSVRWQGLDDEGTDGERKPSWTVDGRPLVTFHFSGYSPAGAPFAISRYDQRYSLYTLPSLARLFGDYAALQSRYGAEENRRRAYRYDRFPSGIRINDEMRSIFKEHETFLWADVNPWTTEGEEHYCQALLSPVPYTGNLLPILFERIYRGRPDLQQTYAGAALDPDGFLRWVAAYGIYEHGYQEIFDRHRPALPSHHGTVLLAEARRESPQLFAGLDAPLGADRHRLLERLRGAGLSTLATTVCQGDVEHYYISPIRMIRKIVEERSDVRHAFPDLLFSDAPGLTRWLEANAVVDHHLPAHAPAVFAAKSQGRSLARLFSYLNRNWDFMERWPLALIGQGSREIAPSLLAVLRHGLEYDLDDVLMFLWIMDEKPAAGLGLTFELAVNARRTPSPLLPEGQEKLLGPLLREVPFQEALRRHRDGCRDAIHRRQEEYVARFEGGPGYGRISVYHALERAALPAPCPGVNFFGYHKSPIGLGNLTRGLRSALEHAGVRVQPNVIGNVAMDADLCPEDFIRTYDYGLDTNLFASYPHLHEMLLETLPEHVVREKRNIVYLAWEQRDGSPYWPEIYRGFDQVWALSSFAAESFRRFMRREVLTVPCVLDFDALPPAAAKEDLGLDPDKLTYLYVLDANSSIERKNPEAAIRAFAAAFTADEKVQLVLRIANAHRLDHRERIKQILRAAPAHLDIRLVLEPMRHTELLRLISAADCYVSLHRAEGFGYTCAEAMAYGKPVIATGYSGNLEFMSAENSFLVDHCETEVRTADGPFQRGSVWAEPDVAHAAHLMRAVYLDQEAARAVGARGRQDVRSKLSAAGVGKIAAAALARSRSS
jgi:glycosyltransferase involved in cell wall biosynthesis